MSFSRSDCRAADPANGSASTVRPRRRTSISGEEPTNIVSLSSARPVAPRSTAKPSRWADRSIIRAAMSSGSTSSAYSTSTARASTTLSSTVFCIVAIADSTVA